jgi:hypothetical protein
MADFTDLMTSIGLLLLHRGHLERRRNGTPLPECLQEVRQVRNLICHGLEAASTNPVADREPFVRCRASDRAEQIYTYSDLQTAIRRLERFNAAVTA